MDLSVDLLCTTVIDDLLEGHAVRHHRRAQSQTPANRTAPEFRRDVRSTPSSGDGRAGSGLGNLPTEDGVDQRRFTSPGLAKNSEG